MNSEIITTKAYNGNHLDIFIDTYIKGDKIINWERCSRKNKTNAVMIVAKHIQSNKIVMISEFRIPINAREIGFPAGLIDENENIEDTIKREMMEETGLNVINITKISPCVYNSSGMTDEGVHIAYVEVDGTISKKHLQNNEDIETFLVDKNEIEKMLENKDLVWGAKAWIICNNIVNPNIFR